MDLAMDLIILAAAQLSLSGLNLRRLLLGQLLLGTCTLFALASDMEGMRMLHLPLMILCAAVATGERRAGRILQAALCMLCLCAAGAGFFLLGGGACAVIGTAALAFLLRRHRHLRFQWNIEVQLALGSACASFPALIDTGNRLREHGSNLPILIVEAAAAGEIARMAASMDETEKRSVPFGVLGSAGEISCFRPDDMHIIVPQAGTIPAPACWVGIYPGRIPGSTCALAPPEFADTVQQASCIQENWDRVRRIFHGIFKREAVHLRSGGADSQGFGLLHRRQ